MTMRESLVVSSCAVLFVACISLSVLPAASQGAEHLGPSESEQKPTLTMELASLDAAYAEINFIFDLIGDRKNRDVLIETLEMSLEGVDPGRTCGLSVIASPDGLQPVASLPVATDADFRKFLRALSDIDVKTAPTTERMPASIRSKLETLKLQPNERLIYSLYDGFLRFAGGYVHLGQDLQVVRLSKEPTNRPTGTAWLQLRVDGNVAPPLERQSSFEKARQKLMERVTRADQDSEAGFALQKALLDELLTSVGLVFSESSTMNVEWTTSREKKQAHVVAHLAPAPETGLAKMFQVQGENLFQGALLPEGVLSGSLHLGVHPADRNALHALSVAARAFAHDTVNRSSEHDAAKKSADGDFVEMVFGVIDDVIAEAEFNGFVQSWSNADGTLTTVGAVRIARTEKHLQRVRSLRGAKRLDSQGSSGLEVYRVPVSTWPGRYQELFDRDGSVLIGVATNAVWFGIGGGALSRLEKSGQSASVQSSTRSAGFDLVLDMRSLSEVWSRIDARRPQPASAKHERIADRRKENRQADVETRPSVSMARSILADLNLSKIAAEAYLNGDPIVTATLKQDAGQVTFSASVGEGTLRFLAQALAKFTKDNL